MTRKEESLLNNHHKAARGATEPNQPGFMRSKAARTGDFGAVQAFSDSWKNGRAHDELKKDHMYQRAAPGAPTVTSTEELSSKTVRRPAARSWPSDKISSIWN